MSNITDPMIPVMGMSVDMNCSGKSIDDIISRMVDFSNQPCGFFSPMEIFGKLEREKFGGFHDKAWDSGLPDVQTVTPLCIRVKLPIFGRCGRINATGICA